MLLVTVTRYSGGPFGVFRAPYEGQVVGDERAVSELFQSALDVRNVEVLVNIVMVRRLVVIVHVDRLGERDFWRRVSLVSYRGAVVGFGVDVA